MSIIYVLIPVAILLTIVGIYFFFWAVKTEQFSDLEKQGMSILFEEENTENKTVSNENDIPTKKIEAEQSNSQIPSKISPEDK
jgi:cbb3-type cytochrome oxidase maturation protein